LCSGQNLFSVFKVGALERQMETRTRETNKWVSTSVTACGGATSGQLAYQWKLNGSNLTAATASSYHIELANQTADGFFTVVVSNSAGTITSAPWRIGVTSPGRLFGWSDNSFSHVDAPSNISNAVGFAVGDFHCLAVLEDGSVRAWGSTNSNQTTVPSSASNVTAVAAGSSHSLALRSNGTVVAWVPTTASLTSACGKAAGDLGLAHGWQISPRTSKPSVTPSLGNDCF